MIHCHWGISIWWKYSKGKWETKTRSLQQVSFVFFTWQVSSFYKVSWKFSLHLSLSLIFWTWLPKIGIPNAMYHSYFILMKKEFILKWTNKSVVLIYLYVSHFAVFCCHTQNMQNYYYTKTVIFLSVWFMNVCLCEI